MALDFTGREIKVGDIVRHAYQPIDPTKAPRKEDGLHVHLFSATGKVLEVMGHSVIVKGSSTGVVPVYLGSLLQVLDDASQATTPYLNPLTAGTFVPDIPSEEPKTEDWEWE